MGAVDVSGAVDISGVDVPGATGHGSQARKSIWCCCASNVVVPVSSKESTTKESTTKEPKTELEASNTSPPPISIESSTPGSEPKIV
jgi:hypothetical protein